MSPWSLLTQRWPDRAFSVRRRLMTDGRFREIAGDYEMARQALRHWQAQDPPGARRIADYEQIVRDLEDEIEASLSGPPPRRLPDPPARPVRPSCRHITPFRHPPREPTP